MSEANVPLGDQHAASNASLLSNSEGRNGLLFWVRNGAKDYFRRCPEAEPHVFLNVFNGEPG